jgi:hypothetical protein
MKKAGAVTFIIGIFFLVIFKIIGVSVDADGFLHEPFFLLPVGDFLIFAGVILFFVSCAKKTE